ncbi:HAD family phosphatase [Paenibacillus sp. SYP-B3998]|uniref:HAD family phosphatase n=1 Tax=Paenibacillus sp. SYP-B3998 TaxID=2678564 RepID=A0A6G4A2N9_9BACL|nr:HAD family hydrolase [Paenibacillus sp. SYP-B3998]NEW08558.1 HAD family phosphatase [Paenibacillus sp. SYP-B3998]
MIKLIVSDLDGTLLDHSKKVSPRELAALVKANEAGIQLCLASGRMHTEIQQVMKEIGHKAFSVSQNGAFIHLDDGTFLQSKLFDPDLALQVYQLLKDFELVKLICSGDANYIENVSSASNKVEARMFQPFIVKEDAEHAFKTNLPTCKFTLLGELEILMQVIEVMKQHIGDQVELFISDTDCLDIMPRNVSKGSSLLVLLEKLGLQPEEVACFGDSFNDISMFGITPHSFAMSGAHPEVRQQAAFQINSVSEGIMHVLNHNEKLSLPEKGSIG